MDMSRILLLLASTYFRLLFPSSLEWDFCAITICKIVIAQPIAISIFQLQKNVAKELSLHKQPLTSHPAVNINKITTIKFNYHGNNNKTILTTDHLKHQNERRTDSTIDAIF